jgi:hypothetical protein
MEVEAVPGPGIDEKADCATTIVSERKVSAYPNFGQVHVFENRIEEVFG